MKLLQYFAIFEEGGQGNSWLWRCYIIVKTGIKEKYLGTDSGAEQVDYDWYPDMIWYK